MLDVHGAVCSLFAEWEAQILMSHCRVLCAMCSSESC
uniref:Uncharacterized protein n=1 Tax=Arundo donax TaxID=35708 RepID=A0A0A9GP69_ARUDO